jgi:hypothetical protein
MLHWSVRRFWKRLITYPLLAVAGIVLVAEETLWRLSGLLALLGKLEAFRRVEAWVRGLPPMGALALFGVPAVALAPVKLLALYWLAGGHPVLGIGTIATAKITGTAVVARLFQLTEAQLLTIGWFRWWYERVMQLRAAAYGLWAESAVGRWWRRERAVTKGFVRRRWEAVRAWWARK